MAFPNSPQLPADYAFTVADAYLFTVLSWATPLKVDLAKWPNIQAFLGRVAARPKVQDTLKAEGLVKH